MRTTLTLEDDLAEALKEEAHRAGHSFKRTVNEVLRAGLAARRAPKARKAYRLRPASLGGPLPGIDIDRALRLADALEDEALMRKLEQRK
ncbi:MAG: DUF2191 domain-containing protein [Acidobacteriota bacterium]